MQAKQGAGKYLTCVYIHKLTQCTFVNFNKSEKMHSCITNRAQVARLQDECFCCYFFFLKSSVSIEVKKKIEHESNELSRDFISL